MYCTGGGSSSITLTTSNIATLIGKQGGGTYYVNMLSGDIKLTIVYSLITTSTSTSGPGGVAYFSSPGNTKVSVDVLPISVTGTATTISYSTA